MQLPKMGCLSRRAKVGQGRYRKWRTTSMTRHFRKLLPLTKHLCRHPEVPLKGVPFQYYSISIHRCQKQPPSLSDRFVQTHVKFAAMDVAGNSSGLLGAPKLSDTVLSFSFENPAIWSLVAVVISLVSYFFFSGTKIPASYSKEERAKAMRQAYKSIETGRLPSGKVTKQQVSRAQHTGGVLILTFTLE